MQGRSSPCRRRCHAAVLRHAPLLAVLDRALTVANQSRPPPPQLRALSSSAEDERGAHHAAARGQRGGCCIRRGARPAGEHSFLCPCDILLRVPPACLVSLLVRQRALPSTSRCRWTRLTTRQCWASSLPAGTTTCKACSCPKHRHCPAQQLLKAGRRGRLLVRPHGRPARAAASNRLRPQLCSGAPAGGSWL